MFLCSEYFINFRVISNMCVIQSNLMLYLLQNYGVFNVLWDLNVNCSSTLHSSFYHTT
jgi:hypothetical protein